MFARTAMLGMAMSISATAFGQITALDLGNYQLSASFALPAVAAAEASAITYNWDNGNLFVLGDEGDALVEVTRTGTMVSSMTLTGFDDTEGLTYIGGGQFVLVEERLQDAYRLNYAAGGSVARASLPSISLGPTVGNIGIEGISYEPLSNAYFAVKEKSPQAVLQATGVTFGFPGTATVGDLFTPALGVSDLSDIQVLSTVSSLVGTADQDNLLIYSQESQRLLEVSRSGAILSQFDFSSLSGSAEGVTIDGNGVIYVTDESPRVFVLTPVPEPSAALLLVGGLAAVGAVRRFKRS